MSGPIEPGLSCVSPILAPLIGGYILLGRDFRTQALLGTACRLGRVLRIGNLVQLGAGFALLSAASTREQPDRSICAGLFVRRQQRFVSPNGSAIAMMRHGKI